LEERYRRFLEGRGDCIDPLIFMLRGDCREHVSSRAWAALILARIYMCKGRIDLASAYLDLASKHSRLAGIGELSSGISVNRAIILKAKGETAAAERLLRSVSSHALRRGEVLTAAKAASNLASLLARAGDVEESAAFCAAAAVVYEALGCEDGLLRIELVRALIDLVSGRGGEAADRIYSCLQRCDEPSHVRERIVGELMLGEVLLRLEESGRARIVLNRVAGDSDSLKRFRPQYVSYLYLRSLIHQRDGNIEDADLAFAQAERLRCGLGLGAAAFIMRGPGDTYGGGGGRMLVRDGSGTISPRCAPKGAVIPAPDFKVKVQGPADDVEEWLITRNRRFVNLLSEIKRAAALPLPILLQGESGVGKEIICRLIHRWSGRGGKPFVSVNAAALPRDLFEGALFGHIRGAYTGAVAAQPGLLGAAGGGTLMLDEIGEIEPPFQAKLLRLVDRGEYIPLGSSTVKQSCARIVAATNRDLGDAVECGDFRADLYYRLSMVEYRIPPLRERREDIPLIAEHVLSEARKRFGLGRLRFGEAAMTLLTSYKWPGNIRELQSEIIKAAVRRGGGTLRICDFSGSLMSASAGECGRETGSIADKISELERSEIVKALHECGGNRTRAAGQLGMRRTTLLYRMKRLGID
jgi:transcriptional regulator with AAA-type ATPase domain/tetratricopeptide (TPR) repeat protein